ncbi:hypothetical protein PsYK624_116510 [Phanerochaete sordida]|uniref:Uncharacterized protein n=1 Tax=Phanerochaete sordida TaxID=48140 RepID=A0A9P3GH14_9APHY|nr:hypothetical protein PsYK624_116510 [Phanerochaete sordida]
MFVEQDHTEMRPITAALAGSTVSPTSRTIATRIVHHAPAAVGPWLRKRPRREQPPPPRPMGRRSAARYAGSDRGDGSLLECCPRRTHP